MLEPLLFFFILKNELFDNVCYDVFVSLALKIHGGKMLHSLNHV